MLRTIERAYEAHRSVPKPLYYSPEPPVWSLRRPLARLPVSSDTLERLDLCHSTIERSVRSSGFSHVGDITRALVQPALISALLEDRVADHDALMATFADGRIPNGIPASADPTDLDDAIEIARSLGYLIPAVPARKGMNRDDERNAFAAAHYLETRRFAPRLLFHTSKFIVPDPLQTVKTAYFFDQLFVTRDENRVNGVRLLALQVGGAIDDRRDALLAKIGYEAFHAAGHWARIDPQRVIFEFFELAGIPTLQTYARVAPGRTINKYHCQFCGGPMIRTATGEGIVEHRDRHVHEECLNPAVNQGFRDDVW